MAEYPRQQSAVFRYGVFVAWVPMRVHHVRVSAPERNRGLSARRGLKRLANVTTILSLTIIMMLSLYIQGMR